MKIEVWMTLGLQVKREEIIDTEKDWLISGEEWVEMDEADKYTLVQEYMMNFLDFGYKTVEE